jgi:hypothetical protein
VQQEEVIKVKNNPSDMHHMHLPHVHALHLHPAHWIGAHPIILALLIAGVVSLLIIGLAYLQNSGGIRFDLPDSPIYPAMYPYSVAY